MHPVRELPLEELRSLTLSFKYYLAIPYLGTGVAFCRKGLFDKLKERHITATVGEAA
jgi:hypothetical protein